MSRVTPIALTRIAWQHYVDLVEKELGHAPSRGVDHCASPLSDFAKYTASLAEFQTQKELDPKQVLRRPGPHLRHTFYSILVTEPPTVILRISEGSDLDVISAPAGKNRMAVVSGTLDKWRDAIIIFCTPESSANIRGLFNEIKSLFDQLGLADIFYGYGGRTLPDGTVALEYKP